MLSEIIQFVMSGYLFTCCHGFRGCLFKRKEQYFITCVVPPESRGRYRREIISTVAGFVLHIMAAAVNAMFLSSSSPHRGFRNKSAKSGPEKEIIVDIKVLFTS